MTPGRRCPCLVELADDTRAEIVFLGRDVPSVGYRSYRLPPHRVPARDGRSRRRARSRTSSTGSPSTLRGAAAVVSLVDLTTGDELITAGEVGNELVVY